MSISRVSTYQANQSIANQLNSTQAKYTKLVEQITTGVRVNSVADDPVSARGIIKADKELHDIENYSSNITLADNQLSAVDGTLDSVNTQLSRAYELAMQCANGTLGSDDLKAYQEELDCIIENMTKLANTQYDGQYVFSGTRTTTAPYKEDSTGMPYNGNDEARYVVTGENTKEQINLIGDDIFGHAAFTTDPATGYITVDQDNSTGIFGALYTMKEAIQDGSNLDDTKLRKAMDGINNSVDTTTAGRTKIGAIQEKFTSMLETYTNDETTVTELKSNLQDTDIASAISDWYQVNQSMQGSYQMLSQTMSTSLLNYI